MRKRRGEEEVLVVGSGACAGGEKWSVRWRRGSAGGERWSMRWRRVCAGGKGALAEIEEGQ